MRHVETTLPDRETTQRVAREILEERLASCAQWWPIESEYWWNGKLETSKEFLLVLKTTLGRTAELQRRLQELHPHEVPYIAAVALQHVSPTYAQWTAREVTARRSR